MLLTIPQVLAQDEVRRLRQLIDAAAWADGKITAGTQSAQEKRNRQLPEDAPLAAEARAIVLAGLARSGLFFTAALPQKVYPPLFNRYEPGMDFGSHIDNSVRTFAVTGQHVRTDISATLFLSAPQDYEGGELVVEDTYGAHSVKLPAGDMVLYPGTSVHHVRPVTRGARVGSFFWVQSMIRDDAKRALLFDMDGAISSMRQAYGDTSPIIALTGTYHNLMRMWADV
jgi:PKHD-type hydroxylase